MAGRLPLSGSEPLSDAADPRLYVPRAASEEVLTKLHRWLEGGRGAAVVAGAAGVGTTLLLRVLEVRERPRRRVLFSPFLHIEPEAVERWLISLAPRAGGGIPTDPLFLALGLDAGPPPAPLLLVDEAHASTLAALTVLGWLARTRAPTLRVVLGGCPGAALERAAGAFGGERLRLELPDWSLDELYALGRATCAHPALDPAARARLAGVDLGALARQAAGSPRMLKNALVVWSAESAQRHGTEPSVAKEPGPPLPSVEKTNVETPKLAETHARPVGPPPAPRPWGKLAVRTLGSALALLAGVGLGVLCVWLLHSVPPPRAEALNEPPPAWTVHVNAQPWAWIRIDGKEAGATPLVHAGVAAGPHEFEATFPDGRRERRVVEIGPDSRFVAFR